MRGGTNQNAIWNAILNVNFALCHHKGDKIDKTTKVEKWIKENKLFLSVGTIKCLISIYQSLDYIT